MTDRLFIIINPSAKSGKALQVWGAVQKYLDAEGFAYEFALSKDENDVENLARNAAAQGRVLVAGVGGDGTLQRIAAGIAGTEAVLGIIPAGTGNDFARTLQIPLVPEAACAVLLHGRTVRLDLGTCNGKYFLNVLGTGLDAEVAAEANRRYKRFSGTLGYLLALVRQLFVYKPCPVQIKLDEGQVSADVWLVAVANGCYYGGGMKVAPDANPQDGLADVIVVTRISRLKFLRLFPRVYSGRHVTHPAVKVFRSSVVEITAGKNLAVQTDGEITGSTPFTVKMEHHAIALRVAAE
ncbi:MAG: diacylglycerol kinase family lipid kinase [Dethiobacter sp.]|jgi:YegS/Rv2252/BmrU family lipid kinase|nr:diacylglycerol kinase family lipid kinase [Dethiobacter sp.]